MPAALSNPLMTLTALIALAGSAGPAVGADFTVPVEGVGIKGLVVDPALMTELPRQQLEASDHGTPARFEGVWLRDVLLAAGAPLGKPMHGRNIPLVVLLTARDGYAASFALAELDPAFRDKPILLAASRCRNRRGRYSWSWATKAGPAAGYARSSESRFSTRPGSSDRMGKLALIFLVFFVVIIGSTLVSRWRRRQ